MHLLAHGGMLPHYQPPAGEKVISPRRKGVKQGALLMLIGVVLVPLMILFSSFGPGRIGVMFEFFAAMSAILCFLGGPLRMLFAAIFEEGAPIRPFIPQSSYAPPVIPPTSARVSALPPAAVNPAGAWQSRPQTSEIFPLSSVTDHTTQLLNRSEPEKE